MYVRAKHYLLGIFFFLNTISPSNAAGIKKNGRTTSKQTRSARKDLRSVLSPFVTFIITCCRALHEINDGRSAKTAVTMRIIHGPVTRKTMPLTVLNSPLFSRCATRKTRNTPKSSTSLGEDGP